MYREEQWEKGYYIVNHQKYRCSDCGRDFIIGKELIEECSQGIPICPYCGKSHVECMAETAEEQLQELAAELGDLGIYLDKEETRVRQLKLQDMILHKCKPEEAEGW